MIADHASAPDGEGTFAAGSLRLGCLLTALLLFGCGHSTTHKSASRPSPCSPAAREIVSVSLRVRPASVSAVPGISSSAVPQCAFRAGSVSVTALVDAGPQAYFRLERTIVEDSQQFSTVRLEPAPEHVARLGLDAAWFPGEQKVMTTDGARLITVSVRWPRVPAQRRRTLAAAVARTYLGPLRPSAADPNGSS